MCNNILFYMNNDSGSIILKRNNNISISIQEISYVSSINYDIEEDDLSSSSSNTSSSSSHKNMYFELLEQIQNKYSFKQLLSKRGHNIHYQFIKSYYNSKNIDAICMFYDINNTKPNIYIDIYDTITCFELDFDNFDLVWERYQLWDKLSYIQKYKHILKKLL